METHSQAYPFVVAGSYFVWGVTLALSAWWHNDSCTIQSSNFQSVLLKHMSSQNGKMGVVAIKHICPPENFRKLITLSAHSIELCKRVYYFSQVSRICPIFGLTVYNNDKITEPWIGKLEEIHDDNVTVEWFELTATGNLWKATVQHLHRVLGDNFDTLCTCVYFTGSSVFHREQCAHTYTMIKKDGTR